MIIAWWSGGITSAVACKKAVELYGLDTVSIQYIETGAHHEDNNRFLKDCQDWYGAQINTIQNDKGYVDHIDVAEKNRYINGPTGARCTTELKRRVREKFEKLNSFSHYVWGFEYDKKEENRADRIKLSIPKYEHLFPLIELKLNKSDCIKIVQDAGIELPAMYKLGFNNNNCIGCVKGGMAYWNMIRMHFPDVFLRMSKTERQLGRSCLKKYFLDELPLDAGRGSPPLVQDCGASGEGCQTQISSDYYNRE